MAPTHQTLVVTGIILGADVLRVLSSKPKSSHHRRRRLLQAAFDYMPGKLRIARSFTEYLALCKEIFTKISLGTHLRC